MGGALAAGAAAVVGAAFAAGAAALAGAVGGFDAVLQPGQLRLGQKYQQSNQWAIETLALAMEPGTVRQRTQAQAWLRFKGYEPTTLRLGPLTRLGGRISAANVAFDDHPNEKRFSDRIETVTVDSVFEWLPRAGLGAPPVRLKI